ncbi:MAG: hypothetical protein ATN35_06925 [Epulopiscium sp. Nele67-Bin004]|nr:MAG: hypothetical protein ATN35_06925 [Epulopiscium sp. Nele67-Bin004]
MLYEIPSNWSWTTLGSGVVECLDKYRKPINAKERSNREGDIPYYGATGQVGWIDDFLINEQLVLVGEDGAPFFDYLKDKAYMISGKAWVNNHAHILKSQFGEVGNMYLMHYLNIFDYRGYVNGSTRLKLTQSNMREIPFPLPPVAEQQRIVDTVESLFSKLDRARELVLSALESFENRKFAILHKAFTGELTAKWREENGVSFDSWEDKRFKDIATIKTNLVNPLDYLDYPHIAPDNIEKKTGKLLGYRTIKEDKVISSKHKFYKGQILYSKIRPYLSKVVLINFEGLCSADMYPIETELNTKFLWYYMLSNDFLIQASTAGSRSLLPKINQKELGQIRLTVPIFEEQAEIARILDTLLTNEQKAHDICNLLEQIDLMKKSILARAFRGKLGTNDPSEEATQIK